MLTAIKGTYRDGKVELDEDPGVVGEATVVVTFLGSAVKAQGAVQSRIMTSGMLAVPGRRMSTLEDFKDAEYDDSRWDRV